MPELVQPMPDPTPDRHGAGMLLLGIDTCGALGSLALARVGEAGELGLLGSAELAGRTAAAELVPALQGLLERAGQALSAVDAFVVVDGPGSFTGIRIGVSTAKALAEATGRPLFSISRLRVLRAAHGAPAAVLDAGRGEFYCGIAGQELLLTREELAARRLLPGPDTVAMVATVAYEDRVAAALGGVRIVPAPLALDALQAALAELLTEVLAGRGVDVGTLEARYIRREDLYRPSGLAPGPVPGPVPGLAPGPVSGLAPGPVPGPVSGLAPGLAPGRHA